MSTPTNEWLDLLEMQTRAIIEKAEQWLSLPEQDLLKRPAAGSWNALECMEHLNRYGAYYLPEIRKRINQSPFAPTDTFKPGILGSYFAKSMEPKEGAKKIKTFKDKDPFNTKLDRDCIKKFIAQQHELIELLDKARNVDLNRTKTSISITKLLTLKLGDTLRFLITHNQRHIVQATKAVAVE